MHFKYILCVCVLLTMIITSITVTTSLWPLSVIMWTLRSQAFVDRESINSWLISATLLVQDICLIFGFCQLTCKVSICQSGLSKGSSILSFSLSVNWKASTLSESFDLFLVSMFVQFSRPFQIIRFCLLICVFYSNSHTKWMHFCSTKKPDLVQ